MILRSPAIALRIHGYSRTSHVVTWLTPEYGRVVTSVKGACRPKSAFLGQYDTGHRCELLFYRRERDGIHAARECAPLAWRPHLRDHWRAAVAAGYLCDLAARVAQPMLEADALFRLLDDTLDHLPPGGAALEACVLGFELAVLKCAGFAPSLTPCRDCAPDAAAPRFALSAGHLVCPHRPADLHGGPTVALDRALLALLRRCQAAPSPAALAQDPPRGNLAVGIRRFLGMFMPCHLDLPPMVRQSLFAWLAAVPALAGAQGEHT